MTVKPPAPRTPEIWWSNGIFFILIHVFAFAGIYLYPPWVVKRASLALAFTVWQLACLGITIGYHRLYSHKAFKANLGVRIVLAILGSAGFQGSIKWWCVASVTKLWLVFILFLGFKPGVFVIAYTTYTDDPVHDPYAATNGLLYSHMGWIFFKPVYDRMGLIEQDDLNRDPVVRLQHKHYVPIALTVGFVVPTLLGRLWDDALGAFVWAGLVSRLLIWHCTFLVNSLAHADGLQPYSDEDTSRGNLLLALLTSGEGNHNFHTFPHDFRSGPSLLDWDPSKWIILALHRLGLVHGLRCAKEEDVKEALRYMSEKYSSSSEINSASEDSSTDESHEESQMKIWTKDDIAEYQRGRPGSCLLILDDFVLDVTSYMGEHPGGAAILREYSTKGAKGGSEAVNAKDHGATWAFFGGLNNHSRAAKNAMRRMRIAQVA